jgi:hypothetical protein
MIRLLTARIPLPTVVPDLVRDNGDRWVASHPNKISLFGGAIRVAAHPSGASRFASNGGA